MKYLVIALAFVLLGACGDDVLPPEQLMDPGTCLTCHPKHYQEWSGSMHAYASDDPVFIALNKRGQRETGGALGLLCVNCHAPMAVANGTITEANVANFDPEMLSPSERGITCYFCHNVKEVTRDHNNGLVLAMDSTMRGGLTDPVDSPAHHSKYDARMDSTNANSDLCGSCHDIVNGHGVRVERTFAEWQESLFGNPDPAFAKLNVSCGGCHMPSSFGLVADAPGLGTTVRDRPVVHSHMWPGIDLALTPFPEMEAQETAVKEFLESSLTIRGPIPRTGPADAPGGICLDPPGVITVRIDNIGSGHSWPSGAAFDRRAWLEVIAYRADNSIVFQSGVVPDGMDPEAIGDPNLHGIWDRVFKADGSPAQFSWEVARSDPQFLLRGPVTNDPNDPRFDHSFTKRYTNVPSIGEIDRITARVRIRPLPYELFRKLVASGDLAAGIEAQLQTLDIGRASKTWLRATSGTGNAINTNCNPR